MALKGVCVLEISGLLPAPFCGMILGDFGASVIRIDKASSAPVIDCLGHGKRSIALNLKTQEGTKLLKKMSKSADVLIEPFRPGVMERLGLGPKDLMAENKGLVYARMSGFGQEGKMAARAGHDINYVSLSAISQTKLAHGLVLRKPVMIGVQSILCGEEASVLPPYAADVAGGGMTCALGILAALVERSRSGLGQVVDLSLMHGAAYSASWHFRNIMLGLADGPKGTNLLDGGTHFYNCYKTKDGRWLTVGAIEPQFYAELLQLLGFSDDEMPQYPEQVEEAKKKMQDKFSEHTLEHWMEVFRDSDACVSPVYNREEAAKAWPEMFPPCKDSPEVSAVNPAPLLSRTPASSLAASLPCPSPGQHTQEILSELGFSEKEINDFIEQGTVATSSTLAKL